MIMNKKKTELIILNVFLKPLINIQTDIFDKVLKFLNRDKKTVYIKTTLKIEKCNISIKIIPTYTIWQSNTSPDFI